jgi:hypothetical protein
MLDSALQSEVISHQNLDNVVRRNFDGVDGSAGLNQRCGVFHQKVFQQQFVTWAREDDSAAGDKVWTPYSEEVSALLEAGHSQGDARVEIDDERYVDLTAMRQCRNDNPRRRRKIQRTEAASGPQQGVHCASPLDLIRASLEESGVAARYLLVISQTEIASSLGLLRSKAGMMGTDGESSGCEVIFGSSFPGDAEYQHLCRNINRVKICMEMGKTVVLLNLRSVMESLYELLNQYFLEYGTGEHRKRYVEIGLGDQRMKCSVHADFRVVIIAEEEEVLNTFPIPLLNRLEKHVLSTAGVLEAESNADAIAAVVAVKQWACAFVSSQENESQGLRDAFVGYSDDLIPANVFRLVQGDDAAAPARARTPLTRERLIELTKEKLLQLATPDAVLRVAYSEIMQQEEEIKEQYFRQQPHSRLRDYVKSIRADMSTITTHEQSPVPSLADVEAEALCDTIASDQVSAIRLSDFDSEREFEAKVRDFHTDEALRLLIVQCRVRSRSEMDLLTNAKYIVQSYTTGHAHDKHVLFLVHLPQKSLNHKYTVAVDGWEPLHMDCILPPNDRNPLDASHLAMTPMRLSAIIAGEASIGELDVEDLEDFFDVQDMEPEPEPDGAVFGEPEPEPAEDGLAGRSVNIRTLLKDTVQAALAKVQNPNASTRAITALIKFMLKRLVPSSDGSGEEELASKRLCERLLQRTLIDMMSKKEELMDSGGEQWVKVRAKDIAFVQKSGSFRGALYTHLQQNVTSVFAAVLTALSTNDNLSLLVSHWDQPEKRERWLALAESEMFSVQGEVTLNPDPTMPYVVTSKWKRGTEPAQSSFSWIIYSAIESMRGKMEQLAGTKTPLQCLREELRQYTHLWLADDEAQLRSYTTDFIRQNYSVGSKQLADLFQFLILEVAKLSKESPTPEASLLDMFASDAPLSAAGDAVGVLDIPAIHCAAWTLDTRLEQLALMLSPATPLGKNSETSGVFEMLHAVLMSVADGITMPSIDVTVLRFVLESLELEDEQRDDASKAWFRAWDALRAPVESWLAICQQSAAAVPELQAELHSLQLRYDRLRCVHLFMRAAKAHQYAHQLYARLRTEEVNPFEPDTLNILKRFLDHCIRDSETTRFPGGMECAICYAMVRKGVALPCRHVFCGECIVTSYPRDPGTLIHDKFQCPQCRVDVEDFIVDPDGDREVTNAATRVCALRDRATQFFLEYVAEFLSQGFPLPVVDALWPIIVGDDLSFNSQEAELELQSSPALCAFLLRVLLTLDESSVGEDCVQLLLTRLDTQQQAGARPRDIGLLTLVTEALEDVFSQRMTKHAHASAEHVQQLNDLIDMAEELVEWDGLTAESKWLQAIAALRIVLKDIAEELYHQASGNAPTAALAPIMQRVHTIFEGCNSNDRGPFMHLLKCILQAQWGGMGAMLQVADSARRTPRMPFAAMIAGVVVKDPELPPDLFVAQLAPGTAKEPYAAVLALCRDVMDAAEAEELKTWVAQHQQPLPMALLSIAVCRVADEQHALGDAGIATARALGAAVGETIPVVADTLNNRVGVDGGQLCFSADQAVADRQVMLLCLHGAAATSTGNALAAPLARMATHSIGDSYLPTMRQDAKDAVVGLMGEGDAGHWFTCPNGHPYYIGNCGAAMQVGKCPACGAVIGATADRSHQIRRDQRAMDLNADNTPKGYALTDEIIASPVPERALTLSGVAMARVILLVSMLSAVAVGPTAAREQAATNLRHGSANMPAGAAGMTTWLTQQLRLTLNALAVVLSKNVDDTVLVVHVVLNRLMQHNGPAGQMWATKPDRLAWEQSFEQTMVAPVVADLDATLQAAATEIEAAAEADEGTSRRLMHELQETASAESVSHPLRVGEVTLQPQHSPELWRYRTRVSVAHFQQRLAAASAEVVADCVAVAECTKRLVALGAMRYLPDILHLQRVLVARLERRISQQDAAEVTLQAKLDELWSGAADSRERLELDRCVHSFLAAWRILQRPVGDGQPAINQGADTVLQLDVEMCTQELTESSMLHFFIPATSDVGQPTVPGQVGVAMVNCLLNHQNELVRKLASEGEEPATISVRSVREEHLITFDEAALLPILFANVDRQVFDLGYGRGHKVEYEFASVETAIRHRFIFGKPRIEVRQGTEITTHLKFRNDVHAGHITAGLKEAIPQSDLKPNMVQNILGELAGSVNKTASTLRALETAIGFLHNSRGDGDRLKDMLLQAYLADVLMMEDDLSSLIGKVAAKTVELRHILSLMQALDQQAAEEEAQMGRDTFSRQPEEYKAPLSPARTAEMRAGLRGQNCHKLAPLLRTFILENLTANMLETYQPAYLLVDNSDEFADGVLELLDELEEYWPIFGELKVTCAEAVSFWKLVVEGGAGSRGGAGGGGAGGGAQAGVAGTMAFRAGQNAAAP